MTAPLVRRSPTHHGTVVAAQLVTPRMRRVTVVADSMRDVAIRPAQDVELHLTDDAGRRVKRRYTIRSARPDLGELDLDVALHGDGPGARWGERAGAGEPVAFQGPRGKLELRPASWHLLAGDESALPAIAAICAALPAHEPAFALIEVADAGEQQPVEHATMRWVHRDGQPAGTPEPLVAALRDWSPALPAGAGRGYLLGETRTVVALRSVLEDERGFDHDDVFVKGYWNLARPDRLAGRAPGTP